MASRPFGGVRQRAGVWQAYYPGPDGQRVYESTRFLTERAAREWLADLASRRGRGSWIDPQAGHQRFDQFATDWLTTAPIADTTRELYAAYLDNHLIPFFGYDELVGINPARIRQWYAAMESKAVPTARARSYSLLRGILNVAVKDGAIDKNPCLITGGGTTRHTVKTVPTIEQALQVSDLMPTRWRFLIVLAVFSAARYGELVGLRRRDLDLDTMTMTVTRQWYRGEFRPTKRQASERRVALPSSIRAQARQHLDQFVGPDPDDLVFPTAHGNPPPNNWINTMVARAALQVGVQGMTFHSLRHLSATLAAQAGATIKELQDRLGQSSARAAMIYQHAAVDRDRQLAEAIGKAATAKAKAKTKQAQAGLGSGHGEGGTVIALRTARGPSSQPR